MEAELQMEMSSPVVVRKVSVMQCHASTSSHIPMAMGHSEVTTMPRKEVLRAGRSS